MSHPPRTGPAAAVIDVKPDHVPMARPPWWVRLMERILQPWIVIKREPDVPPFALMVGVPGRQVGWMSRFGERLGQSGVYQQTLNDVGDLQVRCDRQRYHADQLCRVPTDDRPAQHDAGRRITDDLDEATRVVVDQRLRRCTERHLGDPDLAANGKGVCLGKTDIGDLRGCGVDVGQVGVAVGEHVLDVDPEQLRVRHGQASLDRGQDRIDVQVLIGGDDRADRLRCSHDRPDSRLESVDLPPD